MIVSSLPGARATIWNGWSRGRPTQICFGAFTISSVPARLPGWAVPRRCLIANLQLPLGVGGRELELDRGVCEVAHGERELAPAPAGGPLRAQVGLDVLVGLHGEPGRRRPGVRARRPRPRHHPDLPLARLGLGRARRVQVHLGVLLVAAAGRAVGDEIGGGRRDRPPAVRQPLDAQVVVVDDAALVAHRRHQRGRLAGRARHPHALARIGVVGQRPQRDRDGIRRAAVAAGARDRAHAGRHLGRARAGAGRRGRAHGRRRDGRVPAQVLAAELAEIRVVGVLPMAGGADSHAISVGASGGGGFGLGGDFTRRRYRALTGFSRSIARATAACRSTGIAASQ